MNVTQFFHAYTVVDCGAPTDPDNGRVSTTTTTFSNIAVYTCNTGYNLVGVNVRVCFEDETWTEGEPTCQSEDHENSLGNYIRT